MTDLSENKKPAERKNYLLLNPLRQRGKDLVPDEKLTVSLTVAQHARLSEDGVVDKQPARS